MTIVSDIFFNKPDKWFKIFFYLVQKANHRPEKQFKRGQTFTSYSQISHYTGASKNTIDHFIRWAKKEGMLATRKTTRGMIVTLLTYDKYQTLDNYKSDTVTSLTAKRKRNGSDTINKNVKNDKNKYRSNFKKVIHNLGETCGQHGVYGCSTC